MMKAWTWTILAAVCVALVGAAALTARAEEAKKDEAKKTEKEVTIDQVPAAVKATIEKEAGTNKIEKIEEITKGDEKCYEAEWEIDGKDVEIKVAADGKLIEKEVEIAIDQVPAAVKATIEKEAGAAKIEEITEVTKGADKFYEAKWEAGGKEIELKVAADGKVIDKKTEEAEKGNNEEK